MTGPGLPPGSTTTKNDQPDDSRPTDPAPDAEQVDTAEGTTGESVRDGTEISQPRSGAGAEPKPTADGLSQVHTKFAHANIENLYVGADPPSRSARRKAAGRLDHDDVTQLLCGFVTPRSYDEALVALAADHVTVLEGRAGDGRQAGAVALLQELTDERLVMLSPIVTLTELSERHYDQGHGYVVVDRFVEATASDADFVWRTVRDRLRDCDAYLVITCSSGGSPTVESVRHVRWQRPELPQVLRAHLAEEHASDSRLTHLVERIPAGWRMGEVARLCARINTGEDSEEALGAFSTAPMEHVHRWFEAEPSRREILAVTALSFTSGANKRTFESFLASLEQHYDRQVPPTVPRRHGPGDDAGTAVEPVGHLRDELPARRRTLLAEDGLIVENRESTGLTTRTVLAFRAPDYRMPVLAELWSRYDLDFWDAVRAWIQDNILRFDEFQIAYGLSLLAQIDHDEVQDSYLEPWSRGRMAWPGQVTATYVLWLMCADDAMSRVALRTAVRWATNGTPPQRWTAALAFSGEVGMRYPADAVRRLWNLIAQSNESDPAARLALAGLFSSLVDSNGDASLILRVLARHLRKYRRGRDPRLLNLTMTSIIAIFTVLDHQDKRPSIFKLLRAQPERLELVVRLWADVLCNRFYRKVALEALHDGLSSLEQISDDPVRYARELGEALADALPPREHETLQRAFRTLQARSRQRASILEALLEAMRRTVPKFRQEEEE
ncbi:hypothetical protein I0C86_10860 [Plantactinospora sp. S1510]|uniref:Uncharacterized protein n=1 Tax=Plantactinospora alkalitolerans TaxID=2789879 RepID=A0ABS0GTF8_9ACTN|nr:hypothetical protein [Plantactinospora alkalitolerans]MBF9129465.1 hypothetical protein [Plantactinospora alkalitolerans]